MFGIKLKPVHVKILKFLAQTLIFGAVAYFIYDIFSDNWRQLDNYKDSFNYFGLAFSAVLFALHSFINGFNWHYMLDQSDWQRSGNGHLSKIGQMDVYLKSYTLRYIPGNVIGILSRAIYNKEYKIPMVMSLWGWFLENITYLAISIIIGILVLPFVDDTPLFSWWLVVPAALLGVVLILANDWLKILFNKFLVPKLPKKARDEFVSLDLPLSKRINLTLRFFVSWIIYSLSFLVLVYSMGLDIHLLLVPINALSYAIGYLSIITPSGGGVRELVMGYLLSHALGYDAIMVVLVPVVARVVFIAGELLAFGTFKIFQLIYKRLNK
jgi:uncharacterized membrane protein YbhN (UPF0104 family)